MSEQPTTKERPILHNSHLGMLLGCGYKWEQVHVKGVLDRPSVPMVIGRAADETISANLTRKSAGQGMMTEEEINDVSTDTFRKAWNETPLWLDNEERELGIQRVKELAEGDVRKGSLRYVNDFAPSINPRPDGVQWKWTIDCHRRDIPFDLAGTCDVVTEDFSYSPDGELLASFIDVRDLKVRKTKPSRLEVEHSRQFTLYSMAVLLNLQIKTRYVWMDCFVRPTKTLGVRIETFKSSRDMDDYRVYQNILEAAGKMYKYGVFPPADPERPYSPCHRCSLQEKCPYYNGRRTVALSSAQINEQPIMKEGEIHEVKRRKKATSRTPGESTAAAEVKRTDPSWGSLLPRKPGRSNPGPSSPAPPIQSGQDADASGGVLRHAASGDAGENDVRISAADGQQPLRQSRDEAEK